ncbi:MAG TPA: TonB-dependent receptor [Nevskiaceae bacterium]|nr:TonB-dependent receptor [Nevskiaceae bacterium]
MCPTLKPLARLVAALCVLALPAAWAQDTAAADRSADANQEATAPVASPAAADSATQPEAAPAASQGTASSAAAAAPEPDTIPVKTASEAQPAEAKHESNSGTATRLEDVVVTATKREESVRKLAETVNTLSGDDLEEMGARELSDYLRYIPGITMQEGDTNINRSISIRGLGPQPGGNPTTGVLIENVSTGDPYQSYLIPDLDPFDLHDLEVLKGPQGTLFGAAALNGAIRYVLNKPELENWSVRAFGSYSWVKYGQSDPTLGAMLNMPIGSTAALRGVVVRQKQPGLYDDINVNKNEVDADYGSKTMYRVLGRWEPTERLKLNAFYLKQDGYRNDLSIANNDQGQFTRTDTPGQSTSQQKFDVANIDARYQFDWATLIGEASHLNKKQKVFYDGSAIVEPLAEHGIQTLGLNNLAESTSNGYELRLASPDGGDSPWVWLGGLYYNKYKVNASLNTPVANTQFLSQVLTALGFLNLPPNPVNDLVPTPDGLSVEYIKFDPFDANEKAVFGEITRKFFDSRLSVNVGGRYYQETLGAQEDVQGALAQFGQIIGATGHHSMKSKGFNPKASVTYQWTPDIMHYVTVARGFQFGGLNGPAPIPTDNVYPLSYKPSTIWSYETGVRTDWFEKTLQADLTFFYIDWTDMQLRQNTPSGNTDYIDNVGKARSMGLESAVRWLTPVPGVMLVNAASYIRATVQSPYTTSDGVDIHKGDDLPASPHLQSSTSLMYNLPLWSYTAGASLTYSYIGKAWSNVQHDDIIYDYGTVDANLNFAAPNMTSAPELSVGCNNVLDARGVVGKREIHLQGATLAALTNYSRPRTFTLRLTAHF